MWRPDSDALRGIRQRIVAKPAEWQRASRDKSFRRNFKLGGEALMRPPRGFDKDHEFIEDLKRKSFLGVRDLSADAPLKSGFQKTVESSFKSAEPFMRFLCKSVGVPF
jgi:uncharacterized protein (TIGR02453 family)